MKAFASFRLMIFCFCVCVGLAISVPWFARVADCSQTGGALVCDQVNAGVLDGILSDLCTAVCGEFNDDKSGGRETSNGSWKSPMIPGIKASAPNLFLRIYHLNKNKQMPHPGTGP